MQRGLMKKLDNHHVIGRNIYLGVVLLLVGVGLGAGGYRLMESLSEAQADWRSPAATISVPTLIRNGQQIEIPEGSPLRNKLTINAVAEKKIDHTLVLPAVVEADPARLVKVLPPLAGRITQLEVQLGQLVESGQPLAILESSDLRTAYADYDRAKLLLALATKTRERMRGLGRAGGIAEKDIQQAETDFLTADAEFQRAEARLNQIGAAADT